MKKHSTKKRSRIRRRRKGVIGLHSRSHADVVRSLDLYFQKHGGKK